MTLQEFIMLAGGSVEDSRLPNCISKEEFEELSNWSLLLQKVMDQHSKNSNSTRVTIHLTHSPSLVCRTKPLDDGSVAILIPLGLYMRVRVFARVLLNYYGKESNMSLLNSILDDIPESDWAIVPALIPIFGEVDDESTHWRQLADLNSTIELDPELEPAVTDLAWFAFCYLTCHEYAHAIRDHFSIVKQVKVPPTFEQPSDDVSLRKALEIDADAIAISLMLIITLMDMETKGLTGENASALYWMCYALTLVFRLYDSRRKALSLYSEGIYYHPIVRHRLIIGDADTFISRFRPTMKKKWIDDSTSGCQACVGALRHLDIDVMLGKFRGKTKNNKELAKYLPVTAMNFTTFADIFVDEQVQDARAQTSSILEKFGLG